MLPILLKLYLTLGNIFILRKGIWVGCPENGNFPLLYEMKMSLRRWMGGSKKPQNTLTQYKDGPYF
jgi:hypothetical protein